MDGAAKRGRPDGGGSTGAAVEVDSANPLGWKEGPGVMGRSVGVVERNAVEVDVVVAVDEAAEVGLALAQAYAVGARGEGAGNDLDDFTVVGDGVCEVLNISV